MNKILVLGQTPPPHHGQAIMIQRMLEGVYSDAQLYHVRMGFSDSIDDIGRFHIGKIFHLIQLIVRTWRLSLRHKIKILYYPPASPTLVPVLRDIVFLIIVRGLFTVRIFDFHAAGLSEFYDQSGRVLRWLMRAAYFGPDVAIGASTQAAEDGRSLGAKRLFRIPNGIEDHGRGTMMKSRREAERPVRPTILYVGVLREDKGVLILLEALRLLRYRGSMARLQLVGHFVSEAFERHVKGLIDQNNLTDSVVLSGVLTGDAKWKAFEDADLFCFPSHFVAESFPICLLEALSFGLPIVSTRWRGIPNIIEDGENGFLVPTKDPVAVADRVERLVEAPSLREAMGRLGRAKFEAEYTLSQYHVRINAMFSFVASVVHGSGV